MIAAVLVFVFIVAAGTAFAARSTGITILDDKFQVVHVLNGRKAVMSFKAHWTNKRKVPASSVTLHWLYKIDLPDASRWLYDPAGYTQLVSKKPTLYRIQSVSRFNKLIGINKAPSP
jgi:hypothetical protein